MSFRPSNSITIWFIIMSENTSQGWKFVSGIQIPKDICLPAFWRIFRHYCCCLYSALFQKKACFCKPSKGRDDSMRGELANEIYALFIALGILPGFSQRFHLTWSCKSMNTSEVHFCLSKLLAVLRIRVLSSCQGSLGRFRSFLSKILIFVLFFQESSFYLLCIQMCSLRNFILYLIFMF